MADAAKQAVFDARWILPAPSGIGVYARELALRLPALLPEWRFALLVRPDVDPAALLPPGAEGRAEAVAVPFGPLSPKTQLLLPGLLRRLGADLYHAPSFMLPFRAFRRGGGARVRCLATIHDVIPLVVPDYAPASRTARLRPLFRWCLREAARRADVLLTVSETSRRDIVSALRLGPADAAGSWRRDSATGLPRIDLRLDWRAVAPASAPFVPAPGSLLGFDAAWRDRPLLGAEIKVHDRPSVWARVRLEAD